MRAEGKSRRERQDKKYDIIRKNCAVKEEKRVVSGGVGGEAEHFPTIRVQVGERRFP